MMTPVFARVKRVRLHLLFERKLTMIDNTTLAEVLHPDSPHHRANGKFAPGNQAGKGFGRPKRTQEEQMLTAIKASMPPEKIAATIDEALEIARSSGSWRGLMSVVEFAAAYGLGKPIARVETGGSGLAQVLAELSYDDDTGDYGEEDED